MTDLERVTVRRPWNLRRDCGDLEVVCTIPPSSPSARGGPNGVWHPVQARSAAGTELLRCRWTCTSLTPRVLNVHHRTLHTTCTSRGLSPKYFLRKRTDFHTFVQGAEEARGQSAPVDSDRPVARAVAHVLRVLFEKNMNGRSLSVIDMIPTLFRITRARVHKTNLMYEEQVSADKEGQP